MHLEKANHFNLFYSTKNFKSLAINDEKIKKTNMKQCLHTYEGPSGQKVNFEKSAVFFSPKVPDIRKGDLSSLLEITNTGLRASSRG